MYSIDPKLEQLCYWGPHVYHPTNVMMIDPIQEQKRETMTNNRTSNITHQYEIGTNEIQRNEIDNGNPHPPYI
jgi:hypothetical protein